MNINLLKTQTMEKIYKNEEWLYQKYCVDKIENLMLFNSDGEHISFERENKYWRSN